MKTDMKTLTAPEWAKAMIIANLERDDCDAMTDYFATSTEKTVFLGWSKHRKDLFPELRKAAATFEPTAHLGPGKDVYFAHIVLTNNVVGNGAGYWENSDSPWHRELYGPDNYHGIQFTTQAEADAFLATAPKPYDIGGFKDGAVATFKWKVTKTSVEHREKYSMGHGYYLKGSGRYSSGWMVRKTWAEPGKTYTMNVPAEARRAA